MHTHAVRFILLPTIVLAALTATKALAIGFDSDDFLIAGFSSDDIGVYDRDLTFKGLLDSDFNGAAGLDFDAAGNLIAAGRGPGEVRAYSSAGDLIPSLSFTNASIGSPIDLQVGPNGNYIVATQSELTEFTPSGAEVRTFDVGDYEGAAVLPGNVLWGSPEMNGIINVFDLDTGAQIDTLPADNGQSDVVTLYYSPVTDTVLIGDEGAGLVIERDTDGTFIRSFSAAGFDQPLGVTRGPGGDVFATDEFDDGVYRWRSDGTFVGFTTLSASVDSPINIVWAGNIVPEPTSATLLFASMACVLAGRRARIR